jgi:hypothetical protein
LQYPRLQTLSAAVLIYPTSQRGIMRLILQTTIIRKMLTTFNASIAAGTVFASLLFSLPQMHAFGQEMQMGGHDETSPSMNTFWGQPEKLGPGEMRTFVVLAPDIDPTTNYHAPVSMGVEIDAASLTNPGPDAMYFLDFPIQAARTPFQFMMIGWNPDGHPPVGIYDKPHFDFHFYIQDKEDVLAIRRGTCHRTNCEDFRAATQPVPAQYVPANYADVGLVVPRMGNHLVDQTSAEWHGHPFTRTMMWGAYLGRISFIEPMITLASLTSEPNSCTDFKQPAAYARAGYYPLRYCTQYDEATKKYRVSLEKWVYRSFTPLNIASK